MIFTKVFRYIKTNAFLYLLIVLQLAWGFSYMMIAHNAELTGKEQYIKWSERFRDNEYLLQPIGMTAAMVDPGQHPFERFRQIESKYRDRIPMYYKGLYFYTYFTDVGAQTLEILVLSEQAREKWIGDAAAEVYIDTVNEKVILEKLTYVEGLRIVDGGFRIADQSYPLRSVQLGDALIDFGLNKALADHYPERFALNEMIVVPGEALAGLQENSLQTGEGLLLYESVQIDLPSPDDYPLLRQITDDYNRLMPEGTFYYPGNVMGSVQQGISVVWNLTRQYEVHARIVVIITSLATIGIMLTFLRRRKKDIAVCFMIGSTKTSQWMELLLEIGIVIGSGILLAIFVAFRGNHLGDTVFYDAVFHPQSILWGMAGGLGMVSLVAAALISPLRGLEPAEIISQER